MVQGAIEEQDDAWRLKNLVSRRPNGVFTASKDEEHNQGSKHIGKRQTDEYEAQSAVKNREARSTRERIKAKLNDTIAATKDKLKEINKVKLNDTISATKDKVKGKVGINKAVDKAKAKIKDKVKEKVKDQVKKLDPTGGHATK